MRLLAALVLLLLPVGPGEAGVRFVDVARQAGLTAPTWCGREEKPHLLEQDGTGLALLDYDSDGDLDLYLVNAWRLEGAEVRERGRNLLYMNRGNAVFDDVTEKAGVGDDGWGSGVAVGDLHGDGDPDLFVTNFGPDVLYENNGDGTFSRRSEGPGIDGWSTGAVLFDADADGDLDLFVAAYVECTLDDVLNAEPTLDWKGAKVMLGPFGLEGKANRFYENLGQARFREATKAAGLEDVGLYYSLTVAALDIDGDLDLDLYVANDSNPNYIYINDGGRFQETGLWSGAALDFGGLGQAGMGFASGDADGDGDPDLLLTNFGQDTSTMYQNLGDGLFSDITQQMGIYGPTYEPLSWGSVLADYDLDGDLDLFIANGHIYPQADTAPESSTSYAQTNLLLLNEGGRFEDVSSQAGPGLAVVESSRGVAVGDIDNDGDLDLAVSNVDAPPTLLRNESDRAGSWLMVSAPGALRVVAELGGRRLVRDFVAGGSYVSAGDPRFHLGIGDAERIGGGSVIWPEGLAFVYRNVAVNRTLIVPRRRPSDDR